MRHQYSPDIRRYSLITYSNPCKNIHNEVNRGRGRGLEGGVSVGREPAKSEERRGDRVWRRGGVDDAAITMLVVTLH